MSSRFPATVNLSIEAFSRHGGLTGPHADGWGIAFYEDADVRLIKEPEAAADSDWLGFLRNHCLRSTAVLSHIRLATHGDRRLSNTHPFARELGGRMHVFAHNGNLTDADDLSLGAYRPVGQTDSEHAFCHLLHRLEPLWHANSHAPEIEARIETVIQFAAEIRPRGPANFLYSDGELLFAHGHRRKNADGVMMPPGLHLLCRRCGAGTGVLKAAGLRISGASREVEQEVVLAASVPLTDEGWLPLAEGELAVLSEGRIIARRAA